MNTHSGNSRVLATRLRLQAAVCSSQDRAPAREALLMASLVVLQTVAKPLAEHTGNQTFQFNVVQAAQQPRSAP